MDCYRIFGKFEGESQQSFDSTQLALSVSAPGNRLFFAKTRLAESVLERSVAVFVVAYLAIWTVEERIVLFIVGTEAGSAGSFEYTFVIFARLLTFLATDELLEFLLVSDRLFFVHNPMQLYFIHISEIIQVVDLRIQESFPHIFSYQALHVVIPSLIVICSLLIS
jgi:hypothetical protein